MLEELKRLQAHIAVVKNRLAHFERENTSLLASKQQSDEQHHAHLTQKNSIITQKQDEIDTLQDSLATCNLNINNLTKMQLPWLIVTIVWKKVVPILKIVFRKF